MKQLLLVFSLLAVFNGVLADADSDKALARDTYYRSGYVAGLNLGQGRADIPTVAGLKRDNKNFFGHIYMGYNLSQYFGVQIGYLWLPKAKYTNGASPDIKLKSDAFTGLFKAKYPLGEGFALYGDMGAAILSSKQEQAGAGSASQNATVFAYGGGLDYSFANIGGLHSIIDYLHTEDKNTKTLNLPAYDMVSIGIYYQF